MGFSNQSLQTVKPDASTVRWVGWAPLLLAPAAVFIFYNGLPPWLFMWGLAFSIFAGLKWLTWWRTRKMPHKQWRSPAYLFAWPGMDAEKFLGSYTSSFPRPVLWVSALVQTGLGAICLWLIPRNLPESNPLLRGWFGMLGLVLLLHFGSFRLLAFTWQSLGVAATPIMQTPLRSTSLSEFWGKRWNLGFRQLSHDLVFVPLHRRLGTAGAGFLVFVVSGLIHDLVISVPARGGYGLPTMYFVFQGLGVTLERSKLGRRLGLQKGGRGWIFTAATTAGPAFWLFHPPFVRNVILPFMKTVGAL